MSELTDLIWIEKYRPIKFEDLILENKTLILNYLKTPKSMPSFIFYSNKPGTGKTSCAKIIIKTLDCDYLSINASDERGIDTIREKIKLFASSLSSDSNIKRCVFMDEADSMTRQAYDSMRNLMETYSDNVFFILSCNHIEKIIEPIRSRSVLVDFERPNKADIMVRLSYICEQESLKFDTQDIEKLTSIYYPDMRSMISRLQQSKVDSLPINYSETEFEDFLNVIKSKNITKVYEKVYSGNFKIMEFNKWLFAKVFTKWEDLGLEKASRIALRLADTEKAWNMQCNLEVVFISNILEVMKEL